MCTTCAEDGVDVSSVFFDVRFSSFDATMNPLPLRAACQRASIDIPSGVVRHKPIVTGLLFSWLLMGT